MISLSIFKNSRINILLFICFIIFKVQTIQAQSIKEGEVPIAVMKSYNSSGKGPKDFKPSWSLETSGTYTLYKVGYMISNGFETLVYNKSGTLLYSRKEYYKESVISAEVKKIADKYKEQLTSVSGKKSIESVKYSEIISEKYKYKGYTITYLENGEMKSIHTDADGNITKPAPSTQIKNTAFADKANF